MHTATRNVPAWRWIAVLGVLFIGGSFALPAASTAPRAIASADVPAPPLIGKKARRNCGGCGRVVDIRRIEASATAPVSFEFTVRMHDGTFRMSPAADEGRWRVGDRIVLLGGT